MPCEFKEYRHSDGTVTKALICSRGKKAESCVVCGQPSTKLCDGFRAYDRDGNRKTCDAPMCDKHATPAGKNQDLCPKCVAKKGVPRDR